MYRYYYEQAVLKRYMEKTNDDRLLTTIVNTFEILSLLQERDGATVLELVDVLSMSKSTLYDYLRTLHALEYVVKNGETYNISLKFLDHGTHVQNRLTFLSQIQSPLNQLAIDTDHATWFFVEEHGRAVYIHLEEGENAARTRGRIGMRTYMHCTAAGKAMLARFTREKVWKIIGKHGLPEITSETITEPETLFAELDEIREQGYSFNIGESMKNARAIAAPVIVDDNVIGAITIVGGKSELKGEWLYDALPEKLLIAKNNTELNIQYD